MSYMSMNSKGNYSDTIAYLKSLDAIDSQIDVSSVLDKYGQIGVERLSKVTPIYTGETSVLWSYDITTKQFGKVKSLNFYNSSENDDYNIITLLRYGHATVDGRWVPGNDFVEPIIEELYIEIQNELNGKTGITQEVINDSWDWIIEAR